MFMVRTTTTPSQTTAQFRLEHFVKDFSSLYTALPACVSTGQNGAPDLIVDG